MKSLMLVIGKNKSVLGLADEKYNASELEETLEDTFGELKLSNLLKPCIISSYDIKNGKPHFLSNTNQTMPRTILKLKMLLELHRQPQPTSKLHVLKMM